MRSETVTLRISATYWSAGVRTELPTPASADNEPSAASAEPAALCCCCGGRKLVAATNVGWHEEGAAECQRGSDDRAEHEHSGAWPRSGWNTSASVGPDSSRISVSMSVARAISIAQRLDRRQAQPELRQDLRPVLRRAA